MNRRAAWIAGASAVAGVGGLGAALWRSRAGAGRYESQFWSSRFAMPRGGELVMADLRGHPLLLNFWATWCAPCIKELPMLDAFARRQQSKDWKVVGLAVDNLEPVVQFLERRPVAFPIGLAGFAGVELSRELGNAGETLPFTLVFDRQGHIHDRKRGAIDGPDLQRWVSAVG
jgi:thiol-disulfide isomerase/thioredoxin